MTIRKQGRLNLRFVFASSPNGTVSIVAQVYTNEKNITTYDIAIHNGVLYGNSERTPLTLFEYLWLLRFQKYTFFVRCYPITFNPNAMIPEVPPALDKRKLSTIEKKVIKRLKHAS